MTCRVAAQLKITCRHLQLGPEGGPEVGAAHHLRRGDVDLQCHAQQQTGRLQQVLHPGPGPGARPQQQPRTRTRTGPGQTGDEGATGKFTVTVICNDCTAQEMRERVGRRESRSVSGTAMNTAMTTNCGERETFERAEPRVRRKVSRVESLKRILFSRYTTNMVKLVDRTELH